jgi:two-component system, NarL family, captular synthesis response regulator RcsB
MANSLIRVVLADDHPVIARGIEHEFSKLTTVRLVGSVGDSTELIALLDKEPCDVLVSDYAMPEGEYGDGLALFSLIQRRYPAVKIVVLTMLDSQAVLRGLVAQGISCIVSKTDAVDHLAPAVHTASMGGKYYSPKIDEIIQSIDWNRQGRGSTDTLSQRESEVVRLFGSGMTVNEIAERLSRSKKTISSQKSKAMEKLGITRDVDLLRYAIESGMLSTSPGTSGTGSSEDAREDAPVAPKY